MKRNYMRSAQTNLSSARELLSFVWRSKSWWLTPLVIVLALLSIVVLLMEGSAIAPFIYVLF